MSEAWGQVSRLLEGPRGRQMCLELALAVERRTWPADARETVGALADAVFRAAIGQPGVVLYRSADGDGDRNGGGADVEPVATEVEDLVEALAGVPVEVTDPRTLPDALADVVSSARYWQEPDRIEALTADPRVVSLLEPWARHLVQLPDVAWWADAVAREDQYAVWGPNADRTRERSVEAALEDDRRDEIEEEQSSRRDRPRDPTAACSGWWWSVPVVVESSTRTWPSGPHAGEPLAARCLEDANFYPEDAAWARMTAPPSALVFEVRCAEDWAALCREHPLDVSASRRHDWYRCTGRVGDWVIPDWAGVAQTWQGVHLPVATYLELAGRALDVDATRASVIAGWSPDMTFWLTDVQVGRVQGRTKGPDSSGRTSS